MKEARKIKMIRLLTIFIFTISCFHSFGQVKPNFSEDKSFVIEKKFDFSKSEALILPSDSLINIISGTTISSGKTEVKNITNPFMKRALFCRLEDQVSKKSSIAMRMRLGSLDYVNQIEQKPNYRINLNN